MPTSFPIPLVVLVLGLAGCGGRHQSTAPVERAAEACCTVGDAELQHFAGCRVGGGRCRQAEVFWMRGAVTCGPVDADNCAGGRCCHYRPRYDPAAGGQPEGVAGEGTDETDTVPLQEADPDEEPSPPAEPQPSAAPSSAEPAG
jgi:hypothetical protein